MCIRDRGYLTLEGMIDATEQPAVRLCTACFTGSYPVPLPDHSRLGKHLFEQLPMDLVATDVEGVPLGTPGGAENALLHP